MSRDKEVAKAGVRLRRFLARADSVASCDLARQPDLDKLGREIKFTIESHSGRVVEVQVNLAPEAEVEQAIARMRPVLLQGDDIYWRNVVSGMKLRSVDPSATKTRIDMVEAAWREFPPSYMQLMASNKETGTDYNGSDSELAMDWIYAEFIHADTARAAVIAPTSNEMRRHATTLFAKDGVQYVTNAARMIRELVSDGVLTLDEMAERT